MHDNLIIIRIIKIKIKLLLYNNLFEYFYKLNLMNF